MGLPNDSHPSRIRGRKGVAIRKRHLAANPLCVMCQAKGIVRLAEIVDHITPLAFESVPDHEGLPRQSLCKPCHDRKTAKDFGLRLKPTFGPNGWPIDE